MAQESPMNLVKPLFRLPLVTLAALALSSLAIGQGFLGVSLKAVEEGEGVEIASIQPGSAAQAAGLQVGDRIVRIAGRAVDSFEDVSEVVAEREPGDTVTIVVVRGEERVRVRATLGEPPGGEEGEEMEEVAEAEEVEGVEERSRDRRAWFGITIEGTEGEALQVGTVVEGSPAAKAGVQDGDRILRAGDRPGSDLAAVVSGMKPGETLTVKVDRDGEEQEISVVLGEREEAARAGGGRSIVVVPPDVRVVPPQGGLRLRVEPEIRGRTLRLAPEARADEPSEEIRALREEIRALREEVRALRALIERQGGTGRGAFLFSPYEGPQPLPDGWGIWGVPGAVPMTAFAEVDADGDDCCCEECGCDCDHEGEEDEDDEEDDDDDDEEEDDVGAERKPAVTVPY
jgi:hypothetical protein